jgi:hypothetical protein
MRKIKIFLDKMLPVSIKKSIKSVAVFFEPDYREWRNNYSWKLKRFKSLHKGKSCFIIGNGPSLGKMNLNLLNNCYTFGMNKIFLIFDKVDLNISYYVCVNPYVIEQSIRQIDSLSCPVFIPLTAHGRETFLSDRKNVFYFRSSKGLYGTFSKDISKNVIWAGYTVTYIALQIAYYMGFKDVFLIGVDHNYQYEGKPNEVGIIEGDDPNHFCTDYFKGQKWQFPDLKNSEIAYKLASKFFEKDGRKIYDATIGGKLTVFPKITYEQALERCRICNL